MGRRSKVWEVREDYRPLLFEVKKLFPTLLGHVRVKHIFLCGFMSPSSGFVAKISRNRPPWELVIKDYDYVITFWTTRFDQEPKHYKLFVALHELMHIPEGGFDKENKHTYRKLIDHDVEDFRSLLKSYGIYMESLKDIYKGEAGLHKEDDGPRRFPRIARIK